MNSILTSIIPLFPKWFARPFALPYVAGETTDGAIQAAESVISQGFSVTMDILGEHTKDVNDAKKIIETKFDTCCNRYYNILTPE